MTLIELSYVVFALIGFVVGSSYGYSYGILGLLIGGITGGAIGLFSCFLAWALFFVIVLRGEKRTLSEKPDSDDKADY